MKLYFVVDRTNGVVRAGGQLSGRLIIISTQPVRATTIALYFRGKEYTTVARIERRRVGTGHETQRVRFFGKHQFFRAKMPVPNLSSIIWNGKTVTGRHEVPFRIQLPWNLPSSMHIEAHGDSATIAYCLRAKLNGSGLLQDYQAKQSVHILAKAEPARASPYVAQPTSTKIRSFGLVREGEMTYGAKVPVTKLAPGQTAEAYIALINNSGASLKHVKVELTEVVQWSAQGRHRTVCNRLWTENFPEQHFTGSEKLDKASLKQTRQDANRKQKSYHRVLDAMNDNQASRCTVQVPQGTHESFQGTTVKVSHTLRIKMKTKFGVTNPEFSVPVEIVQEIQPSRIHGTAAHVAHQMVQYPTAPAAHQVEKYPMARAEPVYDESKTIRFSASHPPSMNPDYVATFNGYYEPPANPGYRGMSKTAPQAIATPVCR